MESFKNTKLILILYHIDINPCSKRSIMFQNHFFGCLGVGQKIYFENNNQNLIEEHQPFERD